MSNTGSSTSRLAVEPAASYSVARGLQVEDLRRLLARPARVVFDRMLGVLAAHTPEPSPGFEQWGLPRIAYTAHFLRRFAPPRTRVLDIASGGVFSLLMADALPGVVWMATDAERGPTEFRGRRTGGVAYRYDPAQLVLGPGRVDLSATPPADVITLFEVVEHLPWNPAPLFGSVADRLPVGGRLVVSTPNVCGRSAILAQLRGGSPHQTPFFKEGLWYHKKEYAPWELRQMFEWAGFEVEMLHTANVYRSDPRGWRAWVHHLALLAAAVMSGSAAEVRHLLRHAGSTQFVVGRKVRPPRWDDPPPDA